MGAHFGEDSSSGSRGSVTLTQAPRSIALPLPYLSNFPLALCTPPLGSLDREIFRSEGSMFQMSRAYSLIVRSLENFPAAAMFQDHGVPGLWIHIQLTDFFLTLDIGFIICKDFKPVMMK